MWYQAHLKVLNFLDELNILLGQALLVRCDVNNGTVQLFDLNVEFTDGDFEFFASLGDCDFLFCYVLHLGQQLINFGLEFSLFFLDSEDKENGDAITNLNKTFLSKIIRQI